MKHRFIFIFWLLTFTLAHAQNLYLSVAETQATEAPGEAHVFDGYVHNLGTGVMVVQMTRTVNAIPENWSTSLCFGVNCYPPSTSAPDPVAINPGDSLFFDVTFSSDEVPNSGYVVIRFEDLVSGEKDSVTFTLQTALAPSFSYHFEDTLVNVLPGEAFAFETYIHNLTDSNMVIQVARLANNIPDDWSTTLCLGTSCYPPGDSLVNTLILPGDSVFFDIIFNTSEIAASGEVLLEFQDLLSGQTQRQQLKVVTEQPTPPISVVFKDTSVVGKPGEELVGDGWIFNNTDSSQKVVIIRKSNQLPDGWTSSLCFESCYSPETDTISTNLNKGDSLEFSIHFFTNDQPASGSALLLIFAEGTQDTVQQMFYAETQSTGIADLQKLNPQQFTLLGNYPNPFNSSTTIEFYLPQNAQEVTLTVFTVTGRQVFKQSLKNLRSGLNRLRFEGNGLASGVYLYQLTAKALNGAVEQGARKFLLVK